MDIKEATKSMDTLINHIESLQKSLKNTINSTGTNKLKQNIDSSVKQIGTFKNAFNFGDMAKSALKLGAVFTAVKKSFGFIKDATKANMDMIETQNLFEVQMGKVVDQYGNLDEAQSQYYTKAMAFQDEMNEKLATNKTELQKYQAMYFGMLKSQGVNEDASYMMSESLTKAGYDIASLYNLSVDKAMEKLKSGIAGQTRPLRDIGVDITQGSLQPILDNLGIERSVSQLSYAEKEVARYIAIIQQAGVAQGDFAKTFDSPANSIKVFQNQILELKQVVGSVFSSLLGYIMPVVNGIIMAIKEVFKAIASFFGIELNSSGSGVTSSLGGVADSVEDIDKGIGGATKKAKEFKKQLMGFDEINNITPQTDNSGGAGGGASANGIDSRLLDALKEWDNKMGSINSKAQQIRDKILSIGKSIKELVPYFKSGFNISFGNTNFDGIKKSIESIKKSWAKIWDSSEVKTSLSNYAKTFSFTLGQVVGSVSRIGVNIADGLIGGIEKYFSQNTGRIRTYIAKMFDIKSEALSLVGNFSQAIGQISDVFAGDTAKQIGADIIAMFANPLMSANELLSKFAKDTLAVFVQPIVDNTDKIKTTFENILVPIQKVTGTLAEAFTYIGDKWNEVYDAHIKPLMDSLKNGLSDTFGKFLDVYNTYIVPVLDNIANGFSQLWNEHLKPLVDKIGEFVGSVANALTALWENVLKPLVDWVIENIIPVLAPIIEGIWNTLQTVCGYIADAIGGVIDVFRGIIDFITGIFTGDWNTAWEGIKTFFNGIWEAIKGIVQGVWSAICGIVETAINIVKGVIETVFNGVKDFISTIWNTIKTVISTVWEGITTGISNAINGVKNTISSVFTTISNTISNIWNGIVTTISNVWNTITTKVKEGVSGAWNAITSVFGNIANWFKDKFSQAWQAVKNVFSAGGKIFDGIKDGILSGLKNIVNAIIKGINKVISIPFNGINSALRSIKNIDILGVKPFTWINTIGVPQIPMLAQGAYVGANSPMLAMIGDNKTQGEFVAPENKLKQVISEQMQETISNFKEGVKINTKAFLNDLKGGIRINPKDFEVDPRQYMNYESASRYIQSQNQNNNSGNMYDELAYRVEQAVLRGFRNSEIGVKVKAEASPRGLFNIIQEEERSYIKQTGEPAFHY